MLNASLHHTEIFKDGEIFLACGKSCTQIARLVKGVMRGFVYGDEGEELTTHFYQEGDLVIGSYLPGVEAAMTIQTLSDCELSVANYSEVMSWLHKDREITGIVTQAFQKQNRQLQSRLAALLNLNSLERYALFMKEYPGMINRVPHYFIAAYLGVTPTQLSRARKDFLNKCK